MAATNRRARELARARYARRQEQAAQRAAIRRRRATITAAAVSLVLVVALVGVVTARSGGLASRRAGHTETVAQATQPSASTASPGSAGAALDCAPVPSNAVRTPTPFASEPAMTITRTASYRATIATTCGDVVVALDAAQAPHAVNSFVFLARKGFYDNTICHRLTTKSEGLSVLQCGDPTGTGTGGPGYQFSVENAPADGRYPAGTLAMARGASPDSNGSQFFLTYADSTIPSPDGYTVFGHVTSGLDLLARIGAGGVSPDNPPRPKVPVAITSVTVQGGGS